MLCDQDLASYHPTSIQTAVDTCGVGWVIPVNTVNFRVGEFRISQFVTSSLIRQIFVSTNDVTGLGKQQ